MSRKMHREDITILDINPLMMELDAGDGALLPIGGIFIMDLKEVFQAAKAINPRIKSWCMLEGGRSEILFRIFFRLRFSIFRFSLLVP